MLYVCCHFLGGLCGCFFFFFFAFCSLIKEIDYYSFWRCFSVMEMRLLKDALLCVDGECRVTGKLLQSPVRTCVHTRIWRVRAPAGSGCCETHACWSWQVKGQQEERFEGSLSQTHRPYSQWHSRPSPFHVVGMLTQRVCETSSVFTCHKRIPGGWGQIWWLAGWHVSFSSAEQDL